MLLLFESSTVIQLIYSVMSNTCVCSCFGEIVTWMDSHDLILNWFMPHEVPLTWQNSVH